MKDTNSKHQDMLGRAFHAVGFLVISIVLGIFYAQVYARLAEQSETNTQRTDQLRKLLKTSADVQKQHQLLRQELEGLEQAVATMRERLPVEIPKREFENDVHRAAKEVGFQLEHVTWRPPQTSPSFSRVEVSVQGVGSFASICRFLDEVHQFTRLTKTRRLELETATNSNIYPLQVTFVLVYGVESHDTDKKRGIL